jgi:hypothetical protein
MMNLGAKIVTKAESGKRPSPAAQDDAESGERRAESVLRLRLRMTRGVQLMFCTGIHTAGVGLLVTVCKAQPQLTESDDPLVIARDLLRRWRGYLIRAIFTKPYFLHINT